MESAWMPDGRREHEGDSYGAWKKLLKLRTNDSASSKD